VGGSNDSEVALVFENPEGIGKEENADFGSGDLGPVEINNPEPGNWTLKVYGYIVPETGESFKVSLEEHAEEQWSWITTKGPERIESGYNGTIEANLTIPKDPSLHRLDGYIKISSDNHTVEIPVSVALTGPRLQGLTREKVIDSDEDGQFDLLTLDFGLNTTTPGEYSLEGVLNDCSGNRIELIDQSQSFDKKGSIEVNISGTDIWKKGKCGPMQIKNLILRDKSGNFIDRFEGNITIDRDPRQFQAPPAYLTGFVNQTTLDSIAIGVNLSVIKPGSYTLRGTIADDEGEVLGIQTVKSNLVPGNTTIALQFDPARFIRLDEVSNVHLVNLVLTRMAWYWSEMMMPGPLEKWTRRLSMPEPKQKATPPDIPWSSWAALAGCNWRTARRLSPESRLSRFFTLCLFCDFRWWKVHNRLIITSG
jgi:hypothetical protein